MGGRGGGRRAVRGHGGAAPGAARSCPARPAVEVGWRLHPDHWGHGYATEAAAASLRFGFEEAGLEEIVAFTTTLNTRSQAVMERIGMVRDPERRLRPPAPARGQPAAAPRALPGHARHRLRPYGGAMSDAVPALRLGGHRSRDGGVPRHRVGRAGARRPDPLRVPRPRGRAGRAQLGHHPQAARRVPPRPSPASTPPRWRASRRPGWRSCWPTRASSATGPRSRRRCATPAPSSPCRRSSAPSTPTSGASSAGSPIVNKWRRTAQLPAITPESEALSKRPAPARLRLRRPHRLLRPPAGDRAGQRPPGELLPLRRAHRVRRMRTRAPKRDMTGSSGPRPWRASQSSTGPASTKPSEA